MTRRKGIKCNPRDQLMPSVPVVAVQMYQSVFINSNCICTTVLRKINVMRKSLLSTELSSPSLNLSLSLPSKLESQHVKSTNIITRASRQDFFNRHSKAVLLLV